MNQYLKMFEQMGPEGFSAGVAQLAPYFSTIDPLVTQLRPGYCEAVLKNQKKVHNHLGCIHAIAMCNAAELVGGIATEVSTPDGTRWIPEGMKVEYLVKAKTDLVVKCEAEDIDFTQTGKIDVPVAAYNDEGVKCFTALITMNVKTE
ncbi:DUF4442 domain-containing protein [Oleiphilus sp. HI0133]|nr:DUF4442 domain-containing protein [Oleiphilus sp. HI0133]